MPQREVELILVRQLASYLTLPMFVVDPKGTLIYFNEPAEPVLGRRYDETEELPYDEWTDVLESAERPLLTALEQHRPAHAAMRLRRLDGSRQEVEVTCFPLTGQSGRHLGAVAIVWCGP